MHMLPQRLKWAWSTAGVGLGEAGEDRERGRVGRQICMSVPENMLAMRGCYSFGKQNMCLKETS